MAVPMIASAPTEEQKKMLLVNVDTAGMTPQDIDEYTLVLWQDWQNSAVGVTFKLQQIKINKDLQKFVDPMNAISDEVRGVLIAKQATKGLWIKGGPDKIPMCTSKDALVGKMRSDDDGHLLQVFDHQVCGVCLHFGKCNRFRDAGVVWPFSTHPALNWKAFNGADAEKLEEMVLSEGATKMLELHKAVLAHRDDTYCEDMVPLCALCEKNEWGTGVDEKGDPSKGKACKEMRRLHIMLPISEFPFFVSLSPMSIGIWDTFISGRLACGYTDLKAEVILGLDKATAGGFTFAVIKPRNGAVLKPLETMKYKKDQDKYRDICLQQEVEADDYFNEDDEGSGGVVDAGGAEGQTTVTTTQKVYKGKAEVLAEEPTF